MASGPVQTIHSNWSRMHTTSNSHQILAPHRPCPKGPSLASCCPPNQLQDAGPHLQRTSPSGSPISHKPPPRSQPSQSLRSTSASHLSTAKFSKTAVFWTKPSPGELPGSGTPSPYTSETQSPSWFFQILP